MSALDWREWLVSCPNYFIPGRGVCSTHQTEGWVGPWTSRHLWKGTKQLLNDPAYSLVTVLYQPTFPYNGTILIYHNVLFPFSSFWHALFTTVPATSQQYECIPVHTMVDNNYSGCQGNLGSALSMQYYTTWFDFIMIMVLSYEHFPYMPHTNSYKWKLIQ